MDETLLNQDAFWNEEVPVALVANGVERPCLDEAPPLIYFRTSGSTARECARVLRAGGAGRIVLVTAAHA